MRFILTILTSIFLISANAQLNESDSLYQDISKKDVKYSITAGTSYLSFGNNRQMLCSYFHPQAGYSINSRLRINIGGMFVNTSLFGYQTSSEGTGYMPANSTQATFITIGGTWQAGNKLFVTASVMKNISGVSNPLFPITDIYSVNFEYKFNNNFSVGVELNYLKSDSPLYFNHSPFSYGNSIMPPIPY